MKILFITQICPYPPTNGGAIKTFNILKHLGSRHEVRLLTFIRHESEIPMLQQLKPYCKNIDFCYIKRSKALNLRHAFTSLVFNNSFIIARDSHAEMRAKVLDALNKVDLVYVDHLQMFQFIPDNPPCPVVLDEHNVEWRIIERFTRTDAVGGAGRTFAGLEWKKLRSFELNACSRADMVITVTSDDRDILAANGIPPEKLVHIPIGVDTDYFRPIQLNSDDKNILSFGTMSWPPNIDAASYFIRSIYPAIKERITNTGFTLVGSNPPREIEALAEGDSSIRVTGFVDNLREAVKGTAAFVVPLRIGSGMRVKILDAMAMGLPVVTTSIGCEGISLTSGEHALVADTPDDFAKAVVNLLTDPDLRTRLGINGRSLVEERYSWPPILRKLDEALSVFQ